MSREPGKPPCALVTQRMSSSLSSSVDPISAPSFTDSPAVPASLLPSPSPHFTPKLPSHVTEDSHVHVLLIFLDVLLMSSHSQSKSLLIL